MRRFTWRHQYYTTTDQQVGNATKVINDDPSLTQQHFAEDANLNTLVRRYGIGDGAIPPAAADPSFYGDFSSEIDFRSALESVRHATATFDALPADLRKRFHNDPANLWNFVNDPANVDEAVKIGLLKRETPPKGPDLPPIVPTTTPAAPPAPTTP